MRYSLLGLPHHELRSFLFSLVVVVNKQGVILVQRSIENITGSSCKSGTRRCRHLVLGSRKDQSVEGFLNLTLQAT